MTKKGAAEPRVVVVGGGPAGAATAISLARLGLSTLLLEAQDGPRQKVGECLPPHSNLLADQLGIRQILSHVGHSSHGNQFAWGSAEPEEHDFIFGTGGTGWHIDRHQFEQEIAVASIEAGTDWRYGHRLVGCSRDAEGWELVCKTRDGLEAHRADFVVDATGRTARFARLLGMHRIRYDRLVGIAAYCATKRVNNAFTLVEAVPYGWWYSAQLPGHTMVVVHVTDSDIVDPTVAHNADAWYSLMGDADHTHRRVENESAPPFTTLHVLAAHTERLSRIVGERWLAVGDAAVTYDPLSSHGISAAMEGGLNAASSIAGDLGGDCGAPRAYARLIDQAFAQYLIMHHSQYLKEQRWSEAPFWRRRHNPIFIH